MTDPAPLNSRAALTEALARLSVDVIVMDRAVAADIGALTWEEASLYLRHVQRAFDDLKSAVAAIEAYIVRTRKAAGVWGDVEVPGVGIVRVSRPKARKAWDHEGIAGHVLDAYLSRQPDGEAPDPWAVRDWLLSAGHIDYWRTGVLRSLGIDPDDWCESIPGTPTVRIIGGPDTPGDGITQS